MSKINKIQVEGVDYNIEDTTKQDIINFDNKLNVDYLDDSNSTKKLVTAAEKESWDAKSDFGGDYNDLTNKPSINDIELSENKTSAELGLATTSDIALINSKIPLQASRTNQLVDKNYVNSSISTATAEFKGTFTTLSELQAKDGNMNDYAFYDHLDSLGNKMFDRYKYVGLPDKRVPDGYTQYNSIINQNMTRYINTGIVLKSGYSIEAEIKNIGSTSGNYWARIAGVIDNNGHSLEMRRNNNTRFLDMAYNGNSSSPLVEISDDYDTIILSETFGKINNTVIQFQMPNIDDGYPLYLFRYNSKGTPTSNERSFAIKSFKIKNEIGEYVFDGVPCQNNIGQIGLYDVVTGSFFGDVNGGDFGFETLSGDRWLYEYTLNNSSFTAEQWATINSGLTRQSLDGKQDLLINGYNIKTINNQNILGSGNIIIQGGGDSGLKSVYVNNKTGDDSNDGSSWSNAKKTFESALSVASDECTLYFEGDTNERLNIKTNPNQKILRIVGRDGVRNRILCGTKLTDFLETETSGIYKVQTASKSEFSSQYYSVIQDNVFDTTTLIPDSETHPAQKGREYRLLSTPLPRRTSLNNLISSEKGFFYNDGNLYVKAPNIDFVNHPIYCPTSDGGIYGNDGSCKIEITNIEVLYAPMLITNCPNAIVSDCSCGFALGTGGIKYDDSINVTLKRCEAYYTLNTSGYGDGINAHSSKYESASGNTNDTKIKYVSAELIDCWCHDCSDDGWSDHSACEVIIRGGLYEYNHKGGVVPSSGGKCTCYNVMTRKNCRGFYYVSSNTYQKEKTAYFYCENCISDGEDASRVSQNITRLAGAGFSVDDVGVTVSGWKGIMAKFVNCKSINNAIGFGAGKKSKVNLIDCSVLNSTYDTSKLNDGEITLQTTTILTNGIPVSGIQIDKNHIELGYNSTSTLFANIIPSNATNKNVVWSIVSGDNYITISPSGLNCSVTSLQLAGDAVIRVTTEDGSYTAECSITISNKELTSLTQSGTLSKTQYFSGETLDITGLTITASFDDGTTNVLSYRDLTFEPEKLSVGTTSVIASYTYNGVTKSVTISGITVSPAPIVWEQGTITSARGDEDNTTRIRTKISNTINMADGDVVLQTLNGALASYWWYSTEPTSTSSTQDYLKTGWTSFSTPTTLTKTSERNYLRIAVKKADNSDITADEADTYVSVVIK